MEAFSSTIERRKFILQEINVKLSITVKELVEKFKVSDVTIRQDLIQLERRNQLIKVRGGAILPRKIQEENDLSIKDKQQHYAEKQLIGKSAASLIKENDTLMLDSGSTTSELARNLDQFHNLTIITNALNIAIILCEYKRFSIIIPGGQLRYDSQSLSGHIAETVLKNFYCDKFFLEIDSFNFERGISTQNHEEATLNQIMISIAKEVIVVCDSSKFYKQGFAWIAPISEIDTIVTDEGIPQQIHEQMLKLGKKVIIAQ